jgi:predicted ATPase
MPDLPTGTVTFLFTDVEGSTKLLQELGAGYAQVLERHHSALEKAIQEHGGAVVDTQGDAFFAAFQWTPDALAAAVEAQRVLDVPVRMGIHTCEPELTAHGYVGIDVHLGARIAACGHGGQVLLSRQTRELIDLEVTDLGEHRVKDFQEPVALFQLGSERFPPLKTISNTNLPRPASSFVGRERELGEVTELLRDDARLLTLSGPGGSGKTRLALEAAAELVAEFKAGVFWVGLAPVRDPALVPDTIAQTLGAKDGLEEHVGERELLLLLDNLEQVVEAAPDLASLVESCPNLKLLVTSRELLRVRGEVEYAVPPLTDTEAVELFCERAQAQADQTIAELCRRLDNLPLALELAAARAHVLSPRQILGRLSKRLDLLKGGRDAEARQQTLRAAIEWSYDLLDPDEQRLFARVSVFQGGCTLDAAEEVADADLDTLQSLVDKSLVRHSEERFWMLETIREYAVDRLEASGEAKELRRRHVELFLALAEEAEPHLREGEESSDEWLDRLESEQDNVRAALDYAISSGEHELALKLAAAVWWSWSLRGNLHEGLRHLERVLALGDRRPSRARAYVILGLADLAIDTGDKDTARLYGEEALALFRSLGEPWAVAYTLLLLGLTFAFEDDWTNAQPRFAESVRIFGELGDEHWTLQATRRLAWSYEELGDVEHARTLQEDLLRRARASGDKFLEAKALSVLAQYDLDAGKVDETVVSNLEEAHRFYRGRRSHADRYWHAVLVCRFARASALEGRGTEATQLLGCFESLAEELDADFGMGEVEPWVLRMNEETLALVRAQLDETAFAEAHEAGAKLTVDEAVALATGGASSATPTTSRRSPPL